MNALKRLISWFGNLTTIPAADPDDARRRRLLSVILLSMFGVGFFTLLIALILPLFGVLTSEDAAFLVVAALATLVGVIIFYVINRYWSGRLASVLFLIFFMGVLTLADTPNELANGRSLFLFSLPIIIASVLLGSQSSFIFYLLTSLEIVAISYLSDAPANIPGIISFFFLAFIAWLSARSLEQALTEVRLINKELDQRVADRTHELSESLAREAAEASQREAILQGIADGVIVFDTDGKAVLSNPAMRFLVNLPVEKIENKTIEEILDSTDIQTSEQDGLAKAIFSSTAILDPVRIKWGQKTLSVNAAPVHDQSGKSLGNVAVFRDFTREAAIEQMKNTFVAMVSHELRTPLNAILAYSEMLHESFYGPLNEKQQTTAERIYSNSRRLLDIVSDLLDQAQIEAGRLKLTDKEFKTSELSENLHSVMDKIAADKGLYLKCTIATDFPEALQGDPHRLQQILVNLVNNAVKFTKTGGIDVQIYKNSSTHWAFDVADTGPGIDPDAQKYIFEPFRQVDGTVTRAHGGIGLGLAIVKKLAEMMGGEVKLKSTLGEGTTFTVILPFTPPFNQGQKENKQ